MFFRKFTTVCLIGLVGLFLTTPSPARAQDLSYFDTLFRQVYDVVDNLIPILIGIALLVFLWGLVTYIAKAGNEEARKQARKFIVWGIIIMFVIMTVWGLVALLQYIFGIDDSGIAPPVPSVPAIPTYN
jgi:hypothetical protein